MDTESNKVESVTSRAGRATTVAAIIGAAIWASSPWATGHMEPWDAEGFSYPAALLLGGVVSGVLVPRPVWAHYVGAVLGQVLYMLIFLPVGPLAVLGLAFLLGFSLVFLLGAFAGRAARHRLSAPKAAK